MYKQGNIDLSKRSCVINGQELIETGFAPDFFLQGGGREGWETKSLNELCDEVIFSGSTPGRGAYADSGGRIVTDAAVRILKWRNITNCGVEWGLNERAFVTEEFFQRHIAKRIQIGDILVGTAAHNPTYIGKKIDVVDHIPEEYQNKVMCVAEVMVIRINPTKIDPYYVLMYLRTEEGYEALQRCIRGQTAHIYPKDVKQIQIPIPPEEEMNALKAILDVTKESLKKRREFEKAYHDADKAFLEYVYPDQG